MNIIENLCLNLILMVFPILLYFIYNCYRELKCEKYNHLLLDVALVSSMYLCLKYGNIQKNTQILLFCNLPIIVAYLKNQPQVSVILSIAIIFYSYYYYSAPIIILIIKFFIYFLAYLIKEKKNLSTNTFIISLAIIQALSLVLEYNTFLHFNSFLSLLEIIFAMLLFYILPFILLYLFQLGDQITSLHLTVKELEQDKQIKTSLFKITHEVKNPIAVCKGYLDMMDINDKDKLERYLPIIKSEINRSLDIMNDFMEFSKIKIDKEIIDINMLLEDIEDEFKLLINNKDITFDCKLLNDEVFIEGDYNRLKQVFVNIVKNSLEAIEKSGEIHIITHILKETYYIEVTDTGAGMDEYTLGKIKEMFFTTKVKGNGLGVSLSNEIIKAHNGSMDYTSKQGVGTKVVVKLPISVL